MSYVLNIIILITLVVNIVFPNAFQLFNISTLCLSVFLILLSPIKLNKKLIIFWILLSTFFLLFIYLSVLGLNDKYELMFKYIIAPFLWICVCNYIVKVYNNKTILNWIFAFGVMCSGSVIILYILTSMGYANIANLFISQANINNITGLGFNLHVYGSLVFFSTAFFPIILSLKGKLLAKVILFFLLIIAALLSGRTVLYISIFIAFLSFLFKYRRFLIFNRNTILIIILVFFVSSLLLQNLYKKYFDINIISYFENVHLAKIQSGGGDERSKQFSEIVDAIVSNPLGNGFDNLNIIRDFERPYNFEMLTLSTVMRFGIIVTLFILFSIKKLLIYGKLFFLSNNLFSDIAYLGFLGIVVASFTNPYLESFSFQWMFFFPIVYFYNNVKSNFSL